MTKTMFFSNIDERIKLCKKAFDEYSFFDLVRACFCITISVKNRSCLESCLALNELLLEGSAIGTKTIDTYEEFAEFFGKISGALQPCIADDLTIEDFGEVKIKYGDVFYDIITGTGHNQVFPCIYSLPYLAEAIGKGVELKTVLEYHSSIINYFKEVNNDGEEKIQLVLPSKALFDRTKSFFKTELKKFDLFEISDLLGTSEDTFIEQRHFVERDDNIYPVFNTAILVDLYNIWHKKLDHKHKNQVIDHTVYNILECKVIEKVGTFFDMYMQQNNFFNVHKKDELFQRRIDYMKEHYPDIIKYYELPDGEYRVLPYMVMNKVLFSRYKKIEFPIICIGELREEIRKISK